MTNLEILRRNWEGLRQHLQAQGATDAEIDALRDRMERLYQHHRPGEGVRALGRLLRRLMDRKPPIPEPDLFA